jgi:cystathionine beta-lyase/cystathionine gamma-synthase
MDLTLPPHVSAAWADSDALAAWLVAAATAEAERRAVDAARADAEAVLAAARAPFTDGPATPTEPTLAERMEQIATNAVHLGVTLAVEAGVSPERVAEIVAEITGEAER